MTDTIRDPKNVLRCPHCSGNLVSVVDSRPTTLEGSEEPAIRRRRLCSTCNQRTSTIEVPEHLIRKLFKDKVLALIDRLMREAMRDDS